MRLGLSSLDAGRGSLAAESETEGEGEEGAAPPGTLEGTDALQNLADEA